MKLNNKGMTLMELLVSIVLISLVLAFLMQLLLDLRTESDNNNFAYNNQLNRTDAIYKIENDLQSNSLVGLKEGTQEGKKSIIFEYENTEAGESRIGTLWFSSETKAAGAEDKMLSGNKTIYYLNYTDVLGNKNKWEMKGAKTDNCYDFTYYINDLAGYYYFKIIMPLYNSNYHEDNNEDKNNIVDDIEVNYYKKLGSLNINGTGYLTGKNAVHRQICG